MAQLIEVEKVARGLQAKGIDPATVEKVKSTIIENIEPKTIDKAVLFLGWVTVVLAAGSIILAVLNNNAVPDALWGALGAGIGGLAGIFMGKQ